MKKALIIEDDPDMAQIVSHCLEAQGYTSRIANLAREGLVLGKSREFDLIVLDIMLPDGDGIEVCKLLRFAKLPTPILILSAKKEEIDIVLGLELGADDFISKPFSNREFQARVKAISRRYSFMESPFSDTETRPIAFENLTINRIGRTVSTLEGPQDLTPREFDLLVLLASHPGRAFSRSQLIDLVWGYQFQGFEHTVNSLVNRLRLKIESNPSKPTFILTVWGLGYKFNESLTKMG